jgi:hypothetical protein
MESQGSLLFSQELDAGPCHELDESNSHFPCYLVKSHFNIFLMFVTLFLFFRDIQEFWHTMLN